MFVFISIILLLIVARQYYCLGIAGLVDLGLELLGYY